MAAAPDPHTTAGKAEILRDRRAEAVDRRGAAVEKQHARGTMTALASVSMAGGRRSSTATRRSTAAAATATSAVSRRKRFRRMADPIR